MKQRGRAYHISLVALLAPFVACRPESPAADAGDRQPPGVRPAVIPLAVGERAWLDSSRFAMLKVDPKTVGAEHFALGAEAVPPGSAIPVHRHMAEEELVIVHRGRAAVTLGGMRIDLSAPHFGEAVTASWDLLNSRYSGSRESRRLVGDSWTS